MGLADRTRGSGVAARPTAAQNTLRTPSATGNTGVQRVGAEKWAVDPHSPFFGSENRAYRGSAHSFSRFAVPYSFCENRRSNQTSLWQTSSCGRGRCPKVTDFGRFMAPDPTADWGLERAGDPEWGFITHNRPPSKICYEFVHGEQSFLSQFR